MKTFVINLDKCTDRLQHMRDELARVGLAFERVPAIYGATIPEQERKKVFRKVRSFIALRRWMLPGQLGATLSHNVVYHKIVDQDLPYALIFEDDVAIAPRFRERLEAVQKFLDPDRPQIFCFSAYGFDITPGMPPEIRREKNMWCADGYVVTRAAAKLILSKNEPVIVVCDCFKRWRRLFGLELYHVIPDTVRQVNECYGSDIPVGEKTNALMRLLLWPLDWLLIKMFKV